MRGIKSMKRSTIVISAFALSVAGCATGPNSITQSELEALFDTQELVNLSGNSQSTPDMPGAGTASYTGSVEIYNSEDFESLALFGNVTLTADFAAGTIEGEATGFSEGTVIWTDHEYSSLEVGEAATGTLDLTGGVISDANIDDLLLFGTLQGSDGVDKDIYVLTNGFFVTIDGSGADYVITHGDGITTVGDVDNDTFAYIFGEVD